MKINSIWFEKYRPATLDKYIGNDALKEKIAKYIADSDIPHLLFYGPRGTGKTTLAKIIAGNPDYDSIYINASEERGIDTIRDKIMQFAQSSTFKKLKIVVLDEADYITSTAQAALRNVIETFSLKTRFILTANYLERIIEPIESRCQTYKIEPPTKGDVARHIAGNILDVESIEYELQDLVTIVNKFFPDIRKVVGACQQSVVDGKLVLDDNILGANVDDLLNELVILLKKPSKAFIPIRQLLADSEILDYSPVYSGLWSKIGEYGTGFEGEVAIHLAQYLWSHNTIVDKELNFMACIAQIINTLK